MPDAERADATLARGGWCARWAGAGAGSVGKRREKDKRQTISCVHARILVYRHTTQRRGNFRWQRFHRVNAVDFKGTVETSIHELSRQVQHHPRASKTVIPTFITVCCRVPPAPIRRFGSTLLLRFAVSIAPQPRPRAKSLNAD